MDLVDKQILTALQKQGRISMTDLGKQIGMSQPAVTERVRRLEEKGVITQYRASVSAEQLNKHAVAYLLFHTKDCEKFISFCEQSPDVMECHRISGEYNYLIKVVTDSMRSLEAFINASGKHGNSTTLIVLSSPIDQKELLPTILEEHF
ncbi:Lrp/AsnC family transcriptional regulator [Brevibacillus choshinensis]|uniref:Lrp/AsnC family transcriptional regulator n=1 Tax=Brevibacillus choshinensis TaxID=54911 RepID=UPI002E215F01|nr:Lrp/AsnC family transcriptional regulator [Brevibacillus choshinensis]MED4752033.1 Lrp/AsnC family transcriptional regulator [Brevibacillus choshinensis]MED4784464.1 Lrp/AsnC family transcriptional regulator [Brevibacillus choshinensis]